MIRGHTDITEITERVSALQRSDKSHKELLEQRGQTKARFQFAES